MRAKREEVKGRGGRGDGNAELTLEERKRDHEREGFEMESEGGERKGRREN